MILYIGNWLKFMVRFLNIIPPPTIDIIKVIPPPPFS